MESGLGHEKTGQWEMAAECYLRGIETDEMLEEFYQRLMVCYSRLGRRGQAMALYRRCCHSLAMIGLKPTTATHAIYAELTADSGQ
jgi:DNA-binding SARP family transcriptional activator